MGNIGAILAELPTEGHVPALLVIGFAVLAGTVGAKIFQKLRIPQVVGYITIGLLLGQSGLKIISNSAIESLLPFNFFALGVIGFMIGGELRREALRKHGRQFLAILLSEGLGAFVVVAVLMAVAAFLVTGSIATSAALGLIFGAISSATAPAATVAVLWEYRARGPLTRAVYAIVALDDGLALVLYALAASVAFRLVGAASGGVLRQLALAAYQLLGAAALGAVAGWLLNLALRRVRAPQLALTITIGMLALVVGAAMALGMDLILSAMALGVALVNLAPRRSQEPFQIVERFAAPIYVLFFVVVGARLNLGAMDWRLWLLAIPYVVGRAAGKIAGARLGARWAGAGATLRKYLGLCLFSQGGVAIGLAILASVTFKGIGSAIIAIVTATTIVVELIGPSMVKLAIGKAGEIGLNVTEEDLVGSYAVRDMVDRASPRFVEGNSVAEILHTIAETAATSYPVTDAAGALRGIITLGGLKSSFAAEGLTDWLVASDVMEPVPDTVVEDAPLAEALTRMREQKLDCLPVVASTDQARLVGLLELRAVDRSISREMLRRRQLADAELD